MRGRAIGEFAKRGAERDMFRWPLVLKYLFVVFDDFCCTLHCKAIGFACLKNKKSRWVLFGLLRIKLPIQPYIAKTLGLCDGNLECHMCAVLIQFALFALRCSFLVLVSKSFQFFRIPLMCVDGIEKKEMLVDVGFVLPSDIIDYVLTHGSGSATQSSFYSNGSSTIVEYWMNELQTHVDRLELKPEEFATTLPLMWHEDAVPHWHGSTGTFWSWSTPLAFGGAWSSRHCFVGLTTSSITQATRRAILNILQWDLKVLRAGVRATCDHLGNPFQSGHRAKLSGQPLAMKAAFAYWKGDAEARFTAHDLQLYLQTRICHFQTAARF